MARNEFFRHASHVPLPVKEKTAPGSPVKVGALNGVTVTGVGEGGNAKGHASVWLDGAFTLHVTGTVEVGDPIYLADGALNVEGTDLFGVALAAQASDGDIPVKIIQTGKKAASED